MSNSNKPLKIFTKVKICTYVHMYIVQVILALASVNKQGKFKESERE